MSAKSKIAFVGNSALTMMNFRLGVMKALSRENEVIMVTPKDCDLTPLEGTSIRFVPVEVDCKGLNPFKDLRLLNSLKEIYMTEKVDFVFHYTIKPIIYGSMAATSLGIKHIDVVTGLGYTFIRRNWLFRLSCILHKIALRKTDAVWFLNQDDCDSFVKLKLVNQSKVHVIHGEGVDTNYFTAKKDPKRVKNIVEKIIPKVLWEYGVSDPSDPTWVTTDISWSTNPDVWEAARMQLADIIEK